MSTCTTGEDDDDDVDSDYGDDDDDAHFRLLMICPITIGLGCLVSDPVHMYTC